MATGMPTQGSVLRHDFAANGTMVPIKCASAINLPEVTSDDIDTTCLEATQATSIPGLPTPGSTSFDFRYEGADPGHQLIIEDMQNQTSRDYEIEFADGSKVEFEAAVSGLSGGLAPNDTVVFTASLTVTGQIVWDFGGAAPLMVMDLSHMRGGIKRGQRAPVAAA